ncbi:MAG: hypothetical protein EBU08_02645 [Micrococcales bacterium]|nr:hypothetical protein [Micrococcales bacterium]
MPGAHRDTDPRTCGATTASVQGRNVYVNGLLWSINGDPNTHGGGSLSAATNNVFIGGVAVCNDNDSAAPDSLCAPVGGAHCAPSASGGSSNVFVGD